MLDKKDYIMEKQLQKNKNQNLKKCSKEARKIRNKYTDEQIFENRIGKTYENKKNKN